MRPETIAAFMKDNKHQVILPTTGVREVMKQMIDYSMQNMIVVEKKQPIGIVTMDDLDRIINAGENIENIRIKDIMNARFIALPPTSHVELANRAMKDLELSVIPIVKKGIMKGVFTKLNRLDTFYQNVSFDIIEDSEDIVIDLNIMVDSLHKALTKLTINKTLSDNELCDILAFQDSLSGYSKYKVDNTEKLLEMTYSILAKHLSLRYEYGGGDIIGLVDYLAMNTMLKDIPEYNNDFIAYQRIFDKTVGNPTKEDFINIDLHSVLSQ